MMIIDVAKRRRDSSRPKGGSVFHRPGTYLTWADLDEGVITSPSKTDSAVILGEVPGW